MSYQYYGINLFVAQRYIKELYCSKNRTILNLNLLKTFIKVAELGSFTKAAQKLNQPKSRVSRHIATLEESLGIELVKRTTRQTSLTHSGQEFFQRISVLLYDLEDQINMMGDQSEEVSGTIRVTAPEDIAQTILIKIIREFEIEYPKVKFEVVISNDYLNLAKENIDIAFRAGKLKDSNLKQRKLMDTKIILVASKQYVNIHGRPHRLDDLSQHKLLSFSSIGFNKFSTKKLILKPFLSCDSFSMLLSMAMDHHGIAMLPEFYCQEKVDHGHLEKLLTANHLRSSPLQLVFLQSKNMPIRNRLFIEKAIQFCRKN